MLWRNTSAATKEKLSVNEGHTIVRFTEIFKDRLHIYNADKCRGAQVFFSNINRNENTSYVLFATNDKLTSPTR